MNKTKETNNEFIICQNECEAFANQHDIEKASQYLEKAKQLVQKLEDLIIQGDTINKRQHFFLFHETDFCEINILQNSFQKYLNLWEFAFQFWITKKRFWMENLFSAIKKNDIIITIEEGNDLLELLYKQFYDNEKIMSVLQIL